MHKDLLECVWEYDFVAIQGVDIVDDFLFKRNAIKNFV